MLNIIKSNSHNIVKQYEKENKLSGYNSSLFSILLNSYTRVIKIEGYRSAYSRKAQPYWDIISVKEGRLLYYHSYAPRNLGEYHKIKADLLLRGDFSLDTERVVRFFMNEMGMYNKKTNKLRGGE